MNSSFINKNDKLMDINQYIENFKSQNTERAAGDTMNCQKMKPVVSHRRNITYHD